MLYGVAFLLGILRVHFLASLPSLYELGLLSLFLIVLSTGIYCRLTQSIRWCLVTCVILLSFTLGASWTTYLAQLRLVQQVSEPLLSKTLVLKIRILGLPQHSDSYLNFRAQIMDVSLPQGGADAQHLLNSVGSFSLFGRRSESLVPKPGQVWQLSAKLKPVHATMNPHLFDYESYAFQERLRFKAQVVSSPLFIVDEWWGSFQSMVDRTRYELRSKMQKFFLDKEYGSVLIALAMGDQGSVSRENWDLFNRTGITHLVSISGLHVTLVAALGGLLAFHCWKRMHSREVALAERAPAQVIAAGMALIIAWLYCLLAGWGVPAQRTFFMLAVIAVSSMFRLRIRLPLLLMLSAVLVCVLDPWSMLASGFYLSFGAVALLMMASSGRWQTSSEESADLKDLHSYYSENNKGSLSPHYLQCSLPIFWVSLLARFRAAARLQLMISLALMPMLAFGFHQVSLISPIVNAYAIPWVSMIITPGVLLLMLMSTVETLDPVTDILAQTLHLGFDLMMSAVKFCAALPYASFVTHAVPLWLIVLVMLAIVLWSLPRVFPLQNSAVMLLGLIFIWPVSRPELGEWRMTVLDVGQGGAVLIETHQQNWLFDTGPPVGTESDMAQRVILPFLQAKGISYLDRVVVSHLDVDHAGGVKSLHEGVRVGAWMSSEPINSASIKTELCSTGQVWSVDGVRFKIVHPGQQLLSLPHSVLSQNDKGCVLLVEGKYHSALLTGDIGVAQENKLNLGRVDVVTVGHHGSKTSSSRQFIERHHPRHAIFQVGYLNRYRHPHPHVWERWMDYDTVLHRSDWHGAILIESLASGLNVDRWREVSKRYWRLF